MKTAAVVLFHSKLVAWSFPSEHRMLGVAETQPKLLQSDRINLKQPSDKDSSADHQQSIPRLLVAKKPRKENKSP